MNQLSEHHSIVSFLARRWVWVLGVQAILFFGLGYLARAGRSVSEDATRPTTSHDHDGHEAPAPSMWTCAMDTQIRKSGPGQCPICAMDLVPVETISGPLTGLRQITFSPEARALMDIRTSPVERKFVTVEVRMVGKVAYDETRMKYITARVPGRLDRLYVDYTGVPVKQGDHLVYIYSPELYAAQQELIEALRSARERKSGSRLFQTAGIDLVKSSREKLRLWGMMAEQIREIEQSDQPSDHMTIFSPMGGVVIEKLKQQGDYVKTGERIYTVADLSRVWVKLDAYESDLTWLRYGQPVTFSTEAYAGETFSGRIAFIDPVLNEKTRTVKVRVNLENTAGNLKPEMFVRGVVKAQIAGAGRVIDASLAGKWISPMHPEIIKDHPGKCDICGMPLVPAESLGYVSAAGPETTRPLVVPASAVLRTGKRAIVYVELKGQKQPTYEGREIVLGPRAGDYYQVRGGLREGELVVTNGNFKIDSALQIQAKPSMMTPEGGGGGGHMHGHGAAMPEPGADQKMVGPGKNGAAATMTIPPAFHAQLKRLDDAYRSIGRAVEVDDVPRIHAAFRAFGVALENVDGKLVSGHPAMLWKEFHMLLAADAVEGREIEQPADARRIFEGTTRTMQRVSEQLGGGHGEHDGGHRH